MTQPELYASPIQAYKLSRLVKQAGEVRLAPLHVRDRGAGFYENPGVAQCDEGHAHAAPTQGCTCGFYAVAERDQLWRLGWHTLETAQLSVWLHGKIIEHQHGYRSQYQDVSMVELPSRCWWCGEEAAVLGRRRRRQRNLAPSCTACARYDLTTLDQAAMDLRCQVSFGGEGEEKISTRLERRVLLVQTAPAATLAVASSLLAVITQNGSIAGVGGLLAGGWLAPGRMLAERIVGNVGASLRERHRVIGKTAGAALFVSIGSWVAAGVVSMIYTNM